MAKILLKAREESGLKQREVAERLGRDATYPHRIEHGERDINIVALIDYCQALQVDFIEIMREIDRQVKELRQSRQDETSSS